MVKIKSAPHLEFDEGSLEAIKANRSGDIWNLKVGESVDEDGCGPRKMCIDYTPAVVMHPEGGALARKAKKELTHEKTPYMDKKSHSLGKNDGRGTGSQNALAAKKSNGR